MVLLWLLFPSIHLSSHNSVSPAWGWGWHLDPNSTKTVHGSGERGTLTFHGQDSRDAQSLGGVKGVKGRRC